MVGHCVVEGRIEEDVNALHDDEVRRVANDGRSYVVAKKLVAYEARRDECTRHVTSTKDADYEDVKAA